MIKTQILVINDDQGEEIEFSINLEEFRVPLPKESFNLSKHSGSGENGFVGGCVERVHTDCNMNASTGFIDQRIIIHLKNAIE